jgi:hypothetical protein
MQHASAGPGNPEGEFLVSTPRTPVAIAALMAGLLVACDNLLSIHVLDGGAPADAGDEVGKGDATLAAGVVSDGGAGLAREADAPTDAGVDATSASFMSFGNAACAACAYANCSAEADACAAAPATCASYESCIDNCEGGAACRSRCTVDSFPGHASAAISALNVCLTSKCPTECHLEHGGFGAFLSEPEHADTCQACLDMNAPAEALACASSLDCDAYWRCYATCPTPDCKFACALEHEAGAQLFRPLQGVYRGGCANACAAGNYWACLGKFSWPPAAADAAQVAFTVPVVEFGYPSIGVPGETVSICQYCPCSNTALNQTPAAVGITDEAGLVTLQVDNPSVNSSGLGVSGCVQVTSPDASTVAYYGYWGYPLSEPVVNPALGPGSFAANIAAQSAQVFKPDQLDATLHDIMHVTLLPDSGLIGAAVFDCFDNATPGARVAIDTSDPQVTVYYQASDAGVTPLNGYAFFANVPPGQYHLTAMPAGLDGGASSVESVYVGPDTTTAVGMFPTPPGWQPFP